MITATLLSSRLALYLYFWLWIQDGAQAREDSLQSSLICVKGMPHYPAQRPYPYYVVDLNTDYVHGQFLCDTTTDGGGWIVLQRRRDGRVSFDRNWNDYKNGFGALDTDYWMGLEAMHNLTSRGNFELRIDLQVERKHDTAVYYSSFSVSSEEDNYKLSLGTFNGTIKDAFSYHNNLPFSTPDRDNDILENQGKGRNGGGQRKGGNRRGNGRNGESIDPNNCAALNHGGWWFHDCDNAYLNGPWNADDDEPDNQKEIGGLIEWRGYISAYDDGIAAATEMKIRLVV